MGMDGLSFSNTGVLRESTSRDFANKTESSILKDDMLKQVDKLQTKVKINDEEKKQSFSQDSSSPDGEESPASENESTDDNILKISKEDLDNHLFYVKISKDGEVFELYDKESDRLVEKISPQEINQLLLKLNMATGILVNRSV